MPKIVDHEEQRKAIAMETVHWIATHGIETLSQRNIAKLCGRSKGGLQYYFPDKKSLLLGALEQITSIRMTRESAAQHSSDGGPMEQLRRRLISALPLDAEQQDAWRARLSLYVYASQDADMQSVLSNHAKDVIQAGAEIVMACQSEGYIKPGIDPKHIFQQLQTIVAGISVAVLAMGNTISCKDQVRILDNGIRGVVLNTNIM